MVVHDKFPRYSEVRTALLLRRVSLYSIAVHGCAVFVANGLAEIHIATIALMEMSVT